MEVKMFGNNFMIDRLTKQKEDIESLIKNYQSMGQQTPVNNYISASSSQTPLKDLIEWRILNENEEVDNLYVSNKTLFINDNLMVLKGVDGSLEKWEVKKIYPIDKKDEKINALEEEIKKLKEVLNEHSKSNEPTNDVKQSNGIDDVNVEPKSKATSKSVSK
jgi:hypothetical protein